MAGLKRVRTLGAGKRQPVAKPHHHLYGAQWQRFRARWLAEHPLCVMCAGEGVVKAASVVDHVEPHRGDVDKFWAGPFQSLCASHHSSDKQRAEKARARARAR